MAKLASCTSVLVSLGASRVHGCARRRSSLPLCLGRDGKRPGLTCSVPKSCSLQRTSTPGCAMAASTTATGTSHQEILEGRRIDKVLQYHEDSKHSMTKYAPGPRGLDWANQPNPFRRYKGAELIPLEYFHPPAVGPRGDTAAATPHDSTARAVDVPYPDVFEGSALPPQPLRKSTLSQLLCDALALSAWKRAGKSTWALRVNPSSGNLHPTEGYVVSGPVEGLWDHPVVAHYAPKEHALEVVGRLPAGVWQALAGSLPQGSLFVALTSIHWREAWKYGTRAFRYCQHDVGHAIGALTVSASTLGWNARLLDTWTTADLELLLGLPRRESLPTEAEHVDCLLWIGPRSAVQKGNDEDEGHGDGHGDGRERIEEVREGLKRVEWLGVPNKLSPQHVTWPGIREMAVAIASDEWAIGREGLLRARVGGSESSLRGGGGGGDGDGDQLTSARQCREGTPTFVGEEGEEAASAKNLYVPFSIRQVQHRRRSAVSMSPQHAISRAAFFQMLRRCVLPASWQEEGEERSSGKDPFAVLSWPPLVHLVLFVHRVEGLPRGMYVLVRNPNELAHLRAAFAQDFVWTRPEGCPTSLPLFRLAEADVRESAMRLSCLQDIAGDSCYSLGMLARFEPSLREGGARMYPRLFWETGLIGQLLYLEAHALGISATGIGCFFDDPVHGVLGLEGFSYQSLYHFTVGIPVEDPRILSLAPYPGPS